MKIKANTLLLPVGILIVILLYLNYKKDRFNTVIQEKTIDYDLSQRPHGYTNALVKADRNETVITKSFLTNLITELSHNYNPNGGANISAHQNKYDLLFKDIIINSDKRNKEMFPNPNEYSMKLNLNVDRIYKAELIDVYVPAATDDAVNIPTFANRLYFTYINSKNHHCHPICTSGFITIFAGTYESPAAVACEITRQFNIVLPLAGFDIKKCGVGVVCSYDKNLNRYVFSDMNYDASGTFIIYPENGYVVDESNIVMNSITDYLMLFGNEPYVSGPKYINSNNGVLYVETAQPGDYGEYCDTYVPLTCDPQFSNCIISDIVLTNCKLYLSLGKLNGTTSIIAPDQGTGSLGNVPCMFCQVPNNTTVSSHSVKTLLGQPSVYSSIQFYNPPISKLNKLEIKWYTDDGTLVRILDHCFTVRVYYFQKRLETTDFSFPVP